MSAAISEGKIAVIGDHLVLPDSLLEEDPQRGALDYYIATGKIRKERTPSDPAGFNRKGADPRSWRLISRRLSRCPLWRKMAIWRG